MYRTLAVVAALLLFSAIAFAMDVKIEEDVYTFTNPNNGSGPLWDYGSTNIARAGDDVFISQMETAKDKPPLSNTRWRLLKRAADGWKCVAETDQFIQREPCPLVVIQNTPFLSVNDSTQPEGTKYGNCEPHVLKFSITGDKAEPGRLAPVWKEKHMFTDHSYRGFAADPDANCLLMLNIDALRGTQNACLMTAVGETLAGASVAFPIRACYPQVALKKNAVHVLAIGDIVEPVAEWKAYKFEQTKNTWDYVFRILYYASTPDITKSGFSAPFEIANVDKTAGAISNQDLWISPEDDGYILYTEREVQSALLRDKFFPGKSIISSLHLAIVKDGAVKSRRVLYAGNDKTEPGCARFHVAANGAVYAVLYVTGPDAGNKLLQVYPAIDNPPLIPVPAKKPLSAFCLAGVRAGNKPSNTIDILGQTGDTMAYMQVALP